METEGERKEKEKESVNVCGISSLTLWCTVGGKIGELASFPFVLAAQKQDKVLHHPDLVRTVGSMGWKRVSWWDSSGVCVWGELGLRAWPDTFPFRSITCPLSVLEPGFLCAASFCSAPCGKIGYTV